jgi:Haem-binding uptake, Tiki superfamily, ChaN
MSTKSALIKFQRSILADLRSEIKQSIGPMPAPLQRYYEEYRREFFRFQSISSLPELLHKIRSCNIIYCGDYHSLRQAQITNLELLREIVKSRKVILATELIYSDDQDVLNRYLLGEIDEEKFLRNIHYEETFGFDWQNYKPIFDFAREEKIPVLAIDCKTDNEQAALSMRDREMAKIIARTHLEQADCLIWVMIGDFHLAQTHLPGFVEKELGKTSRRKILILHQNNEALFWKAARSGLHGSVDIIKLNDQVYCILNTAPWIKLHSYFSWLQNSDNDRAHDEFLRLVTSLCRFLKIDEKPLLDFAVYTGHDATFLRELGRSSRIHRYCKTRFKKRQPFVIPSLKMIYLPDRDLDVAAEMAARYIHIVAGGYRPRIGNWKDEFFRRICHLGVGFLASKILNHHREIVIAETDRLNAGRHSSKMCGHYGSLLAERIYEEMLEEQIQLKEVRQFFLDPHDAYGSAEGIYARFLRFS